jgi:hypothetical protein
MAIRAMHESMIKSDLGVIPFDDLIEKCKKGQGGLVSCTCGTYLHHAWCLHAAGTALVHGIITRFPTFMKFDGYRPGTKKSGAGRKRKAKIGQSCQAPTPPKKAKKTKTKSNKKQTK